MVSKYWRVWRTTSLLSVQTAFENRLAAVFFLVGKFIRFFMFLWFMSLITQTTGSVGGYSQREMTVFFLVFNLFDIAGQTFFRGIYWFREQVVSGEFDFRMVKPMSPLFQALTRQTDILDLPLFGIVIVLLINATTAFPAHYWWLFAALSAAAMLVITAIHIVVAALGVATTEVDHTIMIYRDLSAMARFPVDIYAPAIRGFLTFIIPIAIAFTFPAKALLGLLTWQTTLLVLAASAGFFALSIFVWEKALKTYSSASS